MPWENGIITEVSLTTIKQRTMTILIIILTLIIAKLIWVVCKTYKQGTFKGEEKEIVKRANYLVSKVSDSPEKLMNAMPKQVPSQFQGEWAIYSCSMTCKALTNTISLYPKYCFKEQIIKIINVAMSEEIRKYDADRWHEDPFKGLSGNNSHLSYYSHLAWMIGEYKRVYKDNQFDALYHSLCEAMSKRISNSAIYNIPTYPYEQIYIPDMLVAIVALDIYNKMYDGKYESLVQKWIQKAKTEWIDKKTGLLASYLSDNGTPSPIIKGSYSALNCYYLSLIDKDFGNQQYQRLKKLFKQSFPIVGIKEYYDENCFFGFDIDAGPIIFNLSPSGTSFIIGCATIHNDQRFRKQLLRTAEIAGSTVSHNGKAHYLLADIALVGEAITLAMRTSHINEFLHKEIFNSTNK